MAGFKPDSFGGWPNGDGAAFTFGELMGLLWFLNTQPHRKNNQSRPKKVSN